MHLTPFGRLDKFQQTLTRLKMLDLSGASATDYRSLLNVEFKSRQKRNASYSLRAFARDLDMDPGQLSHVINLKKHISLPKAALVARKLTDHPMMAQVFYHLVEMGYAKQPEAKSELKTRIEKLLSIELKRDSNISDDEFETIAQWFSLPLLKLTETPTPQVTKESAAKYFGLDEQETHLTLERLKRLGFVKKVGPYYHKVKTLVTTTDIPSMGLKQFHYQMLKKAGLAIFHQHISKRYVTSVTVKIPPSALNDYKKIIEDAEDKVIALAQKHASHESLEVYHYSSQLISLKKEDFNV